ncbi:Rv3235 family protein [Actinoplanes sp. CA-131856]
MAVRPAPRCEPPFDDEAAAGPWSSGQLALDLPRPAAARPGAVLVSPDVPAPEAAARASRDAGLAVKRFLHACVEVLNGYRPPAHLRHLARPAEAADVVSEGAQGLARLAGLRAGRRPARKPVPVAILRLHLCEPRPGVVEAAAPLQIGEHTWATALRMELHQQAWAATALRLIHQGRR